MAVARRRVRHHLGVLQMMVRSKGLKKGGCPQRSKKRIQQTWHGFPLLKNANVSPRKSRALLHLEGAEAQNTRIGPLYASTQRCVPSRTLANGAASPPALVTLLCSTRCWRTPGECTESLTVRTLML